MSGSDWAAAVMAAGVLALIGAGPLLAEAVAAWFDGLPWFVALPLLSAAAVALMAVPVALAAIDEGEAARRG